MVWRRGVRVGAVVVGLLAVLVARPAGAGGLVTFTDAGGLEVLGTQRLDDRQYDVVVYTAALDRPVHVRVLVPEGYDPAGPALPVLYLFHGTSGRASDWVTAGGVVDATAGLPLIVVMPDAGFDGNGGGWFTNWVDQATGLGPQQWETFHVGQLIPWVDANLDTIAGREGRAVAGLSQGGFGSTTYAARHPDTFLSVASFSGAPAIDADPVVAAGATAIIEATTIGLDRVRPQSMFGSRVTDEINWQGHDPATLVTNLRGVDVWLWTASGLPGELDGPNPNPAAMAIEGATHASTMGFVRRADQLGVPVHLVDYGDGTHIWPYWARDLREYLVPLMDDFAAPAPPPAGISYRSIDPTWTQWGWTVSFTRPVALEHSSLEGASATGFTLRGTGSATVTTPALYPPGATYLVRMSGASGARQVAAVADAGGRLRLTVPMTAPLGIALPAPPAVLGAPDLVPLPATAVTIIRRGA